MSGELPVKSQCLPFSQIPHTTKLFADFLAYSSKVQPFYPRSPYFAEWLKDESRGLKYDSKRRERVATLLERQNTAWGASSKTLENITRLQAGSSALVTGQQVGLFGGPLFSIFKALTAVKLAQKATAAGVDCVPVFWLATSDHDLAEINHVSIPRTNGSVQKLEATTHGLPDAPVGTVTFGEEIKSLVNAAAELLGDSEVAGLLREAYRPGETFGSAFARLFTRLFADWGVILLDGSDPELHAIAEPIYGAAIERSAELDDAVLTRGRALEAAGYHQQVKVTPSSTLLFTLRDGARVPVYRRADRDSAVADFVIGQESISQVELLRRIATTPHLFSPNVLLRPVVQDYLLPTLAYATLVETKPQALLERYGITLRDLFHGPEDLRENLASRTLPQDVQAAFNNADLAVDKSLGAIRDSLARLDQTLVDSATHASSKIHHQLNQLRARAARAELRQSEVLGRHAELLSNALYPGKALQEREIAGIHFVARQGTQLLRNLYDAVHPDCLDHQVISL
ncbi:MAG: bacillithiol biosynthesis cysteine-adding enzyme BshC [Acidobacteria bacterium]|nr:MAG: bacillithiol biosynthesis cysteine-adding enzyme BshC [Acidobacteriota bacterium]